MLFSMHCPDESWWDECLIQWYSMLTEEGQRRQRRQRPQRPKTVTCLQTSANYVIHLDSMYYCRELILRGMFFYWALMHSKFMVVHTFQIESIDQGRAMTLQRWSLIAAKSLWMHSNEWKRDKKSSFMRLDFLQGGFIFTIFHMMHLDHLDDQIMRMNAAMLRPGFETGKGCWHSLSKRLLVSPMNWVWEVLRGAYSGCKWMQWYFQFNLDDQIMRMNGWSTIGILMSSNVKQCQLWQLWFLDLIWSAAMLRPGFETVKGCRHSSSKRLLVSPMNWVWEVLRGAYSGCNMMQWYFQFNLDDQIMRMNGWSTIGILMSSNVKQCQLWQLWFLDLIWSAAMLRPGFETGKGCRHSSSKRLLVSPMNWVWEVLRGAYSGCNDTLDLMICNVLVSWCFLQFLACSGVRPTQDLIGFAWNCYTCM